MKKVTVVGLGYVGLPTAALIANAGYKVHGVDVNEALISELQSGICRLEEPEVKSAVELALTSGNLVASTEAAEADIFIICVPTPVTRNKLADLSMVRSAINATAPFIRSGNLVILESTSPIGTTDRVIARSLELAGHNLEDIDICYCPERVFPGDTVREILENDRVVGGLTPKAAKRAGSFYQSFCKGKPNLTSAAAAEFSKLMENTFRDVNIALANVFSHIAEQAGVDVMDVIEMANKHPRVNVHTPGPGVGGHCIPVDPWFLIEGFPEEARLLESCRQINDGQAEHFLRLAEKSGLKPGSKVAILGAAYRGDIDDARDTPTEMLIASLGKAGYSYVTHDPHVVRMALHCGYPANLTSDLSETLEDASAAFIMTDHTVYRDLTSDLFSMMRTKLIIDTRRVLNAPEFVEDGFSIIRVGAPTLRASA